MLADIAKTDLITIASQIENALLEFPGYISMEIKDHILTICVKGPITSVIRGQLNDQLAEIEWLDELAISQVQIISNAENLKRSNIEREELEQKIRTEVANLGLSSNIYSVRLCFNICSRVLRLIGVNAQWYVLKATVDTDDKDEIGEVKDALSDIGIRYCIAVKVWWLNFFQLAPSTLLKKDL